MAVQWWSGTDKQTDTPSNRDVWTHPKTQERKERSLNSKVTSLASKLRSAPPVKLFLSSREISTINYTGIVNFSCIVKVKRYETSLEINRAEEISFLLTPHFSKIYLSNVYPNTPLLSYPNTEKMLHHCHYSSRLL